MKTNKASMLLVILVPGLLLYGQSKDLGQVVHWLAGYDTTGTHWVVYNLYNAQFDVLSDTSVGSTTAYNSSLDVAGWFANLGNFQGSSPPWDIGDTIVVLGSMDTAYVSDTTGYADNPNHCGFYWVYSDTIIMETPEYWQPDDTLRIMPKPIAAQVGGPSGNIEISIENPAQTLSSTGTYDVLGYWIWADTTGSGTPSKFDKEVAFVAVQGSVGDTTVCIDPVSNYSDAQNVYWAYKLVAQPDTGGVSCPGYSSYYLSANSNPIVIIGIEETQIFNPKPLIPSLEVYPNPFSNLINIKFFRPPGENSRKAEQAPSSKNQITMRIYDVSGRVVKEFILPTAYSLVPTSIIWDGIDQFDRPVPAGVYFVRLTTSGQTYTEKVILLK